MREVASLKPGDIVKSGLIDEKKPITRVVARAVHRVTNSGSPALSRITTTQKASPTTREIFEVPGELQVTLA